MKKTVAELFAGVGGFRVGLNEVTLDEKGNTIEKPNFEFVYANQWEPSTKVQHAFDCYVKRFGDKPYNSNKDIGLVDKSKIPDHTLLVGGFPCQDYSVARSLSKEQGIQGKKGVLWWQIHETIKVKKPPFLLLENVDRLLKSPSKQRGRDFGVMLRTLADLGYGVEWRVINAADYGHVQRRRRVFIFGFHKSTQYFKKLKKMSETEIIYKKGVYAQAFPILQEDSKIKETNLITPKTEDLVYFSDTYKFPFENSGVMMAHKTYTIKTNPEKSETKTLKQIVLDTEISPKYFVEDKDDKFKELKGAKKIERTDRTTGFNYFYSEGNMSYPDPLDKPGRTMLTSEGTVNRSTHVITDIITGQKRILTPVEAERLNEFPDNWTKTDMPERRRYFMMGNALITGLIKKIGNQIIEILKNEK